MAPVDLNCVQRKRKRMLWFGLLATVITLLFTQSAAHPDSPVHETVELIGLTFIAVCILGRTWASMYIGGRKRTVLVQIGPYSLTRNPLYLFSIIGAAGAGFTTGSVVIGLVLGLAAFAVFYSVARSEETFMLEKFGDEFARYAERVHRWVPRFSAWRDEESVPTNPSLVLTTFREACIFLIVLPIFELIEYLQEIGVLTVVLRLP